MKGILALDLATSLGWARADEAALDRWCKLGGLTPGCGPVVGVTYGTVRLGGNCLAARLNHFYRWYARVLSSDQVSRVYYEMALPARQQSSIQAAKVALGLAGIVQAVAWDHSIGCTDVPIATIKKSFTGDGRARKHQMVEAARHRGWEPDSEDAADALGLLDHAAMLEARRAA